MFFEDAMYETKNSKTQKEFQKELQKFILISKLSEKEMTETIQATLPGYTVTEQDRAQKKQRAQLSKRMRDTMTQYLKDYNKTHVERRKTPRVQLDRALADDTLLLLPHPEQNGEYERRYDILVNGTAEKKNELLFDALHEAKQGYTREKLMKLTDEEIVADFENLYRLQKYASAAVYLSEMKDLGLSKEQRKELLDFEREFCDVASLAFCRAKAISEPSYDLLHPDRFPAYDGFTFGNKAEELIEDLDQARMFGKIGNAFIPYNSLRGDVLGNEIQRRELEGFAIEDVTWMDLEQKPLEPWQKRSGGYGVPTNEMLVGNPLIAVLPNGKMKVFSNKILEGGGMALESGPMSVYMDRKIPGALDALSKGLKKVDHWYIRGSQEFKNVQADLEKIQNEWRALGPDPTEYQRNRLREQMLGLEAHCAEYINNKNLKEKQNDRDKERLAAIKAVSQFAKKQIASLRIVDTQAKARAEARRSKENAAERAAFQQAKSQEARDARMEGKLSEEHMKDFAERSARAAAALEKTVDGQIYKYENMKCPKSSAGNMVEGLRIEVEHNMKWLRKNGYAEGDRLKIGVKTICTNLMVNMTLLDMALLDRHTSGFQKEGDQAGAVETQMNAVTNDPRGKAKFEIDNMRDKVKNSPEFQEKLKNLTPESFESFIINREAQALSRKLLPQMFPPQNQQGGPDKSLGKEQVAIQDNAPKLNHNAPKVK